MANTRNECNLINTSFESLREASVGNESSSPLKEKTSTTEDQNLEEEDEKFYDAGEEFSDDSLNKVKSSDNKNASVEETNDDDSAGNNDTTEKCDKILSPTKKDKSNRILLLEDMNELSTEGESDEEESDKKQKLKISEHKVNDKDENPTAEVRLDQDAGTIGDNSEDIDKNTKIVKDNTENTCNKNVQHIVEGSDIELKNSSVVNDEENSVEEEYGLTNEKSNDDSYQDCVIEICVSDIETGAEDEFVNDKPDETEKDDLSDNDLKKCKDEIECALVNDENQKINEVSNDKILKSEMDQQKGIDEHFAIPPENKSLCDETNVEAKKINLQKNKMKENMPDNRDLFKDDISGSLKSKSILKEVNCYPGKINTDDFDISNDKSSISSYSCKVVLYKINFDEYISKKENLIQQESVESKQKFVSDSTDEEWNATSEENCISHAEFSESDEPLIKYVNLRKKNLHSKSYRETKWRRTTYDDSSSSDENETGGSRKRLRSLLPPYRQKLRPNKNKSFKISSSESSSKSEQVESGASFSSSAKTGSKIMEDSPQQNNRESCYSGYIEQEKSLIGVSIPRIDEVLPTLRIETPNSECKNLKRKSRFDNENELDTTVKVLRNRITRSARDSPANKNLKPSNKLESNNEAQKNLITSRTKRERLAKPDVKTEYLKKLIELSGLHIPDYIKFWEDCKTYNQKSERIFQFLKENGLTESPTMENCKHFGLKKERNGNKIEETAADTKRATRSSKKVFTSELQNITRSRKR